MRDKDRIPVVLGIIERVWTKHPDLRLGQLIDIGRFYYNRKISGKSDTDVFAIEDDNLIAGIEYLEKETDNEPCHRE